MTNRRDFLRRAAKVVAGSAVLSRFALAATGAPKHRPPMPESIAALAGSRNVLAGCAVREDLLMHAPDYAHLVAAQSSLIVAENAMKWSALRPDIGSYNFAAADHIVNFAQRHGIQMRGHNLVWHEALPDWFAASVTHENARDVLSAHIRTVMGRYAGRMHSWDVVNEAINTESERPDGLRDTPGCG